MDLVAVFAEFVGSMADVVPDVFFNVQVMDGQRGLVRCALDLVFVASAIDNRLGLLFETNKHFIIQYTTFN